MKPHKELTAYYAHPMSWYNTDLERDDVEFIKQTFPKVVNPNQKSFDRAVRDLRDRGCGIMDAFVLAVGRADAIVFRAFSDGKIGAGVAREIFEAHIWGTEIWEVSGTTARQLHQRDINSVASRFIGILETKERIHAGIK